MPDDFSDVESSDTAENAPTRSARTRAAAEVNQMGVQISALSPADLDRLDLPERLREAIDVCQRLKPRARGRQNRLIGQLLRAEDHESIRLRLEGLRKGPREGVQREKMNDSWRNRIIEEGDLAVEELIAECPQADRQRLRLLGRLARHDPEAKKAKRARRELLRMIRGLRA
jgi:ribosome-associated protein